MEIINTSNTQKQREFILSKLKQGEHSTHELRQMGIYSPPSRIKELRNQGYQIDTLTRNETDNAGVVHRVGVYVLRQQPETEQ